MNSSVNRFSESPRPSGKQSSDSSHASDRAIQPPSKPTPPPVAQETAPADRQQPIPPPSHPKQYRAIGLIEGQYQRSEEQMTRGTLVTTDGTAIEAVLLGRTISLVKNHLDLEKPHLWVVYPRTRQQDDLLHVQIVGVWEPETLNKEQVSSDEESSLTTPTQEVRDGYFSIRGEVVYYSQEKETVIIKIRQSPKNDSERPKFFKLKLDGQLSDRPIGHFFDLQVQLQADTLKIEDATDLGALFRKKKPFSRKPTRGDRSERPSRPEKRNFPSDSQQSPRERPSIESKPSGPRPPIPKPTQRKK
jgi:hypothetical protein